jgi:hypothetical protein
VINVQHLDLFSRLDQVVSTKVVSTKVVSTKVVSTKGRIDLIGIWLENVQQDAITTATRPGEVGVQRHAGAAESDRR